ncbi:MULTISPECIES: helix-turn-helix domain-containing protein [Vibrio]|uniref:helix-turn-helix domain-containing protein n=1 Tax=Vibrio TaxID=662 RepID=UPI0015595BD4|nr:MULTISPECIES: helix-turn-helix domain-containing protein [Vibrio]ELV8626843.1 helix-turn-helix domain-containing protein [Vibrio cidicii]MBG0760696.1 MerR family transcriptional regulator [Vibrio cidicii]
MDIAEVAKQSGLPPSTLRYYEKLGLIISIGRSGLRRQYAPNVLEKLNLISLGRLAGLSLNDIAAMLATSSQDALVLDRDMLNNKAQEIDVQIKRLKAVRDSLHHVANCPHSSHLACPSFQKLMKSVKRHLPELR